MDPSPSFVFCFFLSATHLLTAIPVPFCAHLGLKRHCWHRRAMTTRDNPAGWRRSGSAENRWMFGHSCRFVLLRHPEVKHEAVGAPYWQADAASAAPLPKPTACYPCREQSGIIRFGVSLMFFVRTAEQEHRHFVIFVPGEKSRRRGEKKRGGMPQQLQQQKLSSSPGSRSYAQITSL